MHPAKLLTAALALFLAACGAAKPEETTSSVLAATSGPGNSVKMRFWKNPFVVYTATGSAQSIDISASYNVSWVFQGQTGNGIVTTRQSSLDLMNFQFKKGNKTCNGNATAGQQGTFAGNMACWSNISSNVRLTPDDGSIQFGYTWPGASGRIPASGPLTSYNAKRAYQVSWSNEQGEQATGVLSLEQSQPALMTVTLAFNGRTCFGQASKQNGGSFDGSMTCESRTYNISIR